jgi:hypothetical protein
LGKGWLCGGVREEGGRPLGRGPAARSRRVRVGVRVGG